MKKKAFGVLICAILVAGIIPISQADVLRKNNELVKPGILIPPDANRIVKSVSLSPDPGFYETSGYMIGSIAVGVIFLESNGVNDPDKENWTPVEELNVQQEIAYALQTWWASQDANAGVSFVIDWQTKVPTTYEPITHASGITNNAFEKLWVSEAMAYLGYSSGDWMQRTRSYVNALRQSKGTDWGYAIFVVDSSNDMSTDPTTPGSFTDNFNAYAYTGGPFCVLTYDNGAWGITRMDQVCAHETAHIFWATEEYNHALEYSGYLNASDNDGSGCLMDTNALCLSAGTKGQIGWRDTDSDNIHDIVDTNPDTTLTPYNPDPTTDTTLVFLGSATVVPFPNNNPCLWNSGNDVTINTISTVQYNVDGGYWGNANPKDGAFDSATEDFTITIGPLSVGMHTIQVRAMNSVGNFDLTPDSDTVTIVVGNTPPATPSIPSGPTSGTVGSALTYSTSTTDPDNDNVKYGWDWNGDGTVDEWTAFKTSGQQVSTPHTFTSAGTYNIKVKAEDTSSGQSSFSTALTVTVTAGNSAPAKPSTPSGPTNGKAGTSYTYTASTIDPNGDQISYFFDWGDGTDSGWLTPIASGQTVSASKTWSSQGSYNIKVKARDNSFAESPWSDPLSVSMPKNKFITRETLKGILIRILT